MGNATLDGGVPVAAGAFGTGQVDNAGIRVVSRRDHPRPPELPMQARCFVVALAWLLLCSVPALAAAPSSSANPSTPAGASSV
ncbi:MAG: hypothetical protein ACREPF_11430, partial [Rhodanobacteraceae bacterium]